MHISVRFLGAENVQLVGASNSHSGRLEVFHNGVWGTVCSDMFGTGSNTARVICRMKGLPVYELHFCIELYVPQQRKTDDVQFLYCLAMAQGSKVLVLAVAKYGLMTSNAKGQKLIWANAIMQIGVYITVSITMMPVWSVALQVNFPVQFYSL